MSITKIVIVGDSYSALAAFFYLQKQISKTRVPVDLLFTAGKGFYFYENLLCQYLNNNADITDIAQGFRSMEFLRPGVSCLQALVLDINLDLKIIKTTKGEVNYDYLVLAPEPDLASDDGLLLDLNSFKIKMPSDILKIQNHIVRNLERAVYEKNLELKKSLLTVSVIGSTKEGIEYACSLSDFLHDLVKKQYPELNESLIKIYLLEENKNILVDKDPFYKSRIFYNLNKKGIVLCTNSKVKQIKDDKIQFNDEQIIYSKTNIVLENQKYSSLIQMLPLEKDEFSNACVDLYLKAGKYENVFVIGECSKCLDLSEDLTHSIHLFNHEAKICAYNIYANINSIPQKPFKPVFSINFLSLGKRNSLIEIKGLCLDGFLPWLFYRLFYISQFLGLKKKMQAIVSLFIYILSLKENCLIDTEIIKERQLVKS